LVFKGILRSRNDGWRLDGR